MSDETSVTCTVKLTEAKQIQSGTTAPPNGTRVRVHALRDEEGEPAVLPLPLMNDVDYFVCDAEGADFNVAPYDGGPPVHITTPGDFALRTRFPY